MKSWISKAESGRLGPPGASLRQVRFAVALGFSLSLHTLLLSPAFSQFQPAQKLENTAGSSGGTSDPWDDRIKHRMQVFLPSDVAVARPPVALTPAPTETTSATALAGATAVPAAGLELMTLPAATVALFAEVIAPTVNPAMTRADDAFACV